MLELLSAGGWTSYILRLYDDESEALSSRNIQITDIHLLNWKYYDSWI